MKLKDAKAGMRVRVKTGRFAGQDGVIAYVGSGATLDRITVRFTSLPGSVFGSAILQPSSLEQIGTQLTAAYMVMGGKVWRTDSGWGAENPQGKREYFSGDEAEKKARDYSNGNQSKPPAPSQSGRVGPYRSPTEERDVGPYSNPFGRSSNPFG